jgi:hypothetical protein
MLSLQAESENPKTYPQTTVYSSAAKGIDSGAAPPTQAPAPVDSTHALS